MMSLARPRPVVLGAVLLAALGFVAANAHLVTVALGSQPDCVLATPTEEGAASHRAAKHSC